MQYPQNPGEKYSTDYSLYTAVCAVCSRVFSHLWQMADHQMYTLERRRRKPEHGVRLRGSERASAREPPATRVSPVARTRVRGRGAYILRILLQVLQLNFIRGAALGGDRGGNNSETKKRSDTVTRDQREGSSEVLDHTIRHALTVRVPASSHTGRISLRARASASARNNSYAGLSPKRGRHQRKDHRATCRRATL